MTAEQYTAKPGHSEHQTGLAFDVGTHRPMKDFHKDFQNSKEAHWLERHVAEYGFIIRYPKDNLNKLGMLMKHGILGMLVKHYRK